MVSNLSEDKADLVRRLRCAEGHLHGITTMIERDADCPSIVQQIVAVQAALRQATSLMVKHHLCACLDECLHSPDVTVREHCLAEVISLYQLRGGSLPPVSRKELL